MRINRFLLVVTSVLLLGYFYLGARLIEFQKPLVWLALLIPFLFMLWVPWVYWQEDDPRPPAWKELTLRISFLCLGLGSFVLCFTFIRDLALLLAHPAFLQGSRGSLNVALLSFGTMALGFINTQIRPKVERVEIPLNKLPKTFDGFRIVQLSDLHITTHVRAGHLHNLVDQVNIQNPDLIALTGDFIDGTPEQLSDKFKILSKLKSTHGTYFIPGNHEYYWDVEAWLKQARANGFKVLLNQADTITKDGEKLYVIGFPDLWGAKFQRQHKVDPELALEGLEPSITKIALIHQPRAAFNLAKHQFDLQLSGHTHAGQFFPWTYVVRLVQPFVKGLNKLGEMWIYVHRGTGYWGPPVRLGAPTEIAVLDLKALKTL